MGKAGQTYSLRVKQKKKSKRVSIVHTHIGRQTDRERAQNKNQLYEFLCGIFKVTEPLRKEETLF